MMGVQEIVHIVGELIGDGEAMMEQRHGPQAVSAAQGARSLLADRLHQDVPYDALWEDFESDPRGTAAQLTGMLEAIVEADPSLAQELDAFMQEYYRAVGPPRARVTAALQESALQDEPDIADAARADLGDEDFGHGTYLYGNLEPGSVSVGERVGAAETAQSVPGEVAGISLEPAGSASPFEDLRAAIETHPDIEHWAKDALKNALWGVLTEEDRGIEASEERLLYHLLTMKRLNGDIFEIVLTRLTEQDNLPGPVSQAVMKARAISI